jgi:menaquinone-dependent protoporphyrinogen IX oxidase
MPTAHQLADRTEDLSRFESEGGSTEHSTEQVSEQVFAPAEKFPRREIETRDSDQRGRVLIVSASREPHFYVISEVLVVQLRSHGFSVEIGDATTGTMPPPQDYDAVVLGVSLMLGRESALIAAYIDRNRDALSDMPTALFTVSKSGTGPDHAPGGPLEQFLRRIGWQPQIAAAFAGGEPFPRQGVLARLASALGYAATSYEGNQRRTSWTDVRQLADAIAIELANAAATAEPHHRVTANG